MLILCGSTVLVSLVPGPVIAAETHAPSSIAATTPLWGGRAVGPSTSNTSEDAPQIASPLFESANAAVAYQGNATHDGQSGGTLEPGLTKLWSKSFTGALSYPLVVNGTAYVTVQDSGNYGTELYAIDDTTGAVSWGPIDLGGTYYFSGITYENGEIFAVDYDGLLREFNATTGAPGWSVSLPGQHSFTAPPTASDGTVYLDGAGSGGTLYAVSEATGAVRWTAAVENGDKSSPVVTPFGVYVAFACGQAYDFAPSNGALIWHHTASCEGGGGKTAALADGQLYMRDPINGNLVLDPDTGSLERAFTAGPIPAFAGSDGYFLHGSTLTAEDGSGNTLWSFAGDGLLDSAPVVINGNVFVGSSSGMLYALDAYGGAQLWSTNVGSAITAPDEQNADNLTGMASDGTDLLVSASSTLVDYGSSSPSTAPTSGDSTLSGVVQAGGSPLSGVCASLLDDTDDVIDTTTTATNGAYTFANESPGDYTVQFDPSCAGTVSSPWAVQYFSGVSSFSASTEIVLAAGEDQTNANVTLVAGAQIAGTVTANGPAAPGVCVSALDHADGSVTNVATTASDGTYILGSLPADTYNLFIDPTCGGDTSSTLDEVYNGSSPDFDGAPLIVVSSGADLTGQNAALVTQAKLGGIIHATNAANSGNMCIDAVDSTHHDVVDFAETATSGAGGFYNLAPDSYNVYVDPTCFATQLSDFSPQYLGGATPTLFTIAAGGINNYNQSLTASSPPRFTSSTLSSGTVGSFYGAYLPTAGGVGTGTWTATGLPAGLSINSATGGISGTPTTTGTYSVSAGFSDTSTQPMSATSTLSLTINPVIVPTTTTTLAPTTTTAPVTTTTVGTSGGGPITTQTVVPTTTVPAATNQVTINNITNNVTVNVTKVIVNITVTSAPTTETLGAIVSYALKLTPKSGKRAPTGTLVATTPVKEVVKGRTVTVTKTIGTTKVTSTTPHLSLMTSTLGPGSHAITLKYEAGAGFASVTKVEHLTVKPHK